MHLKFFAAVAVGTIIQTESVNAVDLMNNNAIVEDSDLYTAFAQQTTPVAAPVAAPAAAAPVYYPPPAAPVAAAAAAADSDGPNDLSSNKLSKYALFAGLGGLALKFLMPKIKGDGDDAGVDAGFKGMMADKLGKLEAKLEASAKM